MPVLQNYMRSSNPLDYVLRDVTSDIVLPPFQMSLPAQCQDPSTVGVFCVNTISGQVYIIPSYKNLLTRGRVFTITIEVRDNSKFPVIIRHVSLTLQVVGNCDKSNSDSNNPCPTSKTTKKPNLQTQKLITNYTKPTHQTQKTMEPTRKSRPTKKTRKWTRKPSKRNQRRVKINRKVPKPQLPEGEGIIQGTLNVIKAAPIITQNLLFMIPTICISAAFVSGASVSVVFAARKYVRQKRDKKKAKDDDDGSSDNDSDEDSDDNGNGGSG